MGNHDYLGNVRAQVEYSRHSDNWKMPACYYSFSLEAGSVSADFFVIDTYPIRLGDRVADSQLRWLESGLSQSTATWKIVMGHHPAFSNGDHGRSWVIRRTFEGLFAEYGVDLYFSGHDHDLQLLETSGEWLQVVSGAGANVRPVRWMEDTLFAESQQGFVWARLTETEMALHFVALRDDLMYSYHRARTPVVESARASR